MNPVTKHLTILLTDIKGFTDRTSHQTRAAIQALLDEHKAIVLPILEKGGGTLVKTIGDAFLMTFESPTDAVLAGVAVQEALRERNQGRAEDDRIEVRIAINSGEVNLSDGDIFGEPVNITARIEGVAEAGEVFFTEAVYLAMNKTEVPSSEVGLFQLKGIPEKMRVYKVRRETPVGTGEVPPAKRREVEPSPKAFKVEEAPVAAPARPTAAAPAGGWKRAPLLKRGVATLIDVVIVSIIVSHLFGGFERDADAKAPAKPAAHAAADVRAGAGGLHIKDGGDEVSLGSGGLHVRDADGERIDVGPGGVAVNGKPVELQRGSSSDDGGRPARRRRRGLPFDNLLFAVFWFVMNLVFLKRWGATPGKKIMGLKVVKHPEGGPLDKHDRLLRSATTLLSGYAAGLGYVWVLFNKERRGWHDIMAGTMVVSE